MLQIDKSVIAFRPTNSNVTLLNLFLQQQGENAPKSKSDLVNTLLTLAFTLSQQPPEAVNAAVNESENTVNPIVNETVNEPVNNTSSEAESASLCVYSFDPATFARLQNFLMQTSVAFRELFADPDFTTITTNDLVELMLDYCERDPSSEFPFPAVAQKIYEARKNQK